MLLNIEKKGGDKEAFLSRGVAQDKKGNNIKIASLPDPRDVDQKTIDQVNVYLHCFRVFLDFLDGYGVADPSDRGVARLQELGILPELERSGERSSYVDILQAVLYKKIEDAGFAGFYCPESVAQQIYGGSQGKKGIDTIALFSSKPIEKTESYSALEVERYREEGLRNGLEDQTAELMKYVKERCKPSEQFQKEWAAEKAREEEQRQAEKAREEKWRAEEKAREEERQRELQAREEKDRQEKKAREKEWADRQERLRQAREKNQQAKQHFIDKHVAPAIEQVKMALAKKNGDKVSTLYFMVDAGDNIFSGTLDIVNGVKRDGNVNLDQVFPIVKAAIAKRMPGVQVHREDLVVETQPRDQTGSLPLFGVDWKDSAKLRSKDGKQVKSLVDVANADRVVAPDEIVQIARDMQVEQLSQQLEIA